MKHLQFLVAVFFVLAGYISADAAGFQSKKLEDQVTSNWTGGYAGITVGHYEQNLNIEGLDLFADRGYVGGVHAGFDQQLGRFVYGIRGSYNWILDDISELTDAKNTWDVIVRGGPLITPNVLIYGLVGYGQVLNDNADDITGWKWGVGIETKLYRKVHVSLEYQKLFEQDFNDFELDKLDTTSDGSVIRAGISYRFGN